MLTDPVLKKEIPDVGECGRKEPDVLPLLGLQHGPGKEGPTWPLWV